MNINVMLAPVIKTGARCGQKRTGIVGVTIHNTDNFSNGAGSINHGKYLQNGGSTKQASWHYVVDDKCVVQCIPEEEVAWHAGDGNRKGNMQTIAIEICVNPDSNLTKATDNAAKLAANILKRYDLPATALFQHNHWSGKNCPSQIRIGKPYDWTTFCSKVVQLMNGITNDSVMEEKAPDSDYTGNSIVDYLKSIGEDSSYANRVKLAKQYGLTGYGGSAKQNELLLGVIRDSKTATSCNTVIEKEAKVSGMQVATSLPTGTRFWLSENATIYGGSSYGVSIPTRIKKATTKYTSGGERVEHGCTWVLAKEIMSWVKVQECLIR